MLDNKGSRFVNGAEIMRESEVGRRSNFCEQLKLQYISESIAFEKHVLECVERFRENDDLDISIGRLRDALSFADNNKTRTEINQWLARGCGASVEDTLLMEAKRTPIVLEDFKKRLRKGLLVKSPPQAK